MEKQQLAARAFAESTDGTVKCLNEKCTKALKTMEDIANHVDRCLKLPEYFKYIVSLPLYSKIKDKIKFF